MKHIELDAAKDSLAHFAAGVKGEPLVVTREGTPLTVLLSVDGMDLESMTLSTDAEFLEIIQASRSRHPVGSGLSRDDLLKELGE